MANLKSRRIADPVHGTIELYDVEQEIIETRIFQRLRNVKQLGLAHLIYPAADYSRFSHSIGACHVAGLIAQFLVNENRFELSSEQIRLFRVAALLHDIGHYPFSHAMEDAVENFYQSNKDDSGAMDPIPHVNHEQVGELTLKHDPELVSVLSKYELDPVKIWQLVQREVPKFPLRNLVSADLDVDRIDYLQRTAHHTALPYGRVDMRYLLSQLFVDDEDRLAVSNSALRTVEHLLFGRYYDYLHVSFHKTVQGLEWVLKESVAELLKRRDLRLSRDEIIEMIKSGQWSQVDDFRVYEKIKELAKCSHPDPTVDKANAVLHRTVPALIVEYSTLRSRVYKSEFEKFFNSVESKIPDWSEQFKIDTPYWHLWKPRKMRFTKGPPPPLESNAGEKIQDEALKEKHEQENAAGQEYAPRIMNPDGESSKAIYDCESSLFHHLSTQELFLIRLYVVLPDRSDKEIRNQIANQVCKDFPEHEWIY